MEHMEFKPMENLKEVIVYQAKVIVINPTSQVRKILESDGICLRKEETLQSHQPNLDKILH